jgi:hypothetical protein
MAMDDREVDVRIRIAHESEYGKFKHDLQDAFRIAAEKEFGHKLDEPIPSDTDIDESINSTGSIVYQVLLNNEIAGGAIVSIDEKTQYNKLLLFFITTNCHDRGIGYKAWIAIEREHPRTKVWETVTPYFEKRNIHFYVNKCGFKIVEFYNEYNPDPNKGEDSSSDDENDEMFRFEKIMK